MKTPFHFPLTLSRSPSRPPAANAEESPEDAVLDQLRQTASQDQAPGCWMLLGEPGSGKSLLLDRWFRRWFADGVTARPGLAVPVLVRLRDLVLEDLQAGPALADRLWRRGIAFARQAGMPAGIKTLYRTGRGRLWRPVWLLDGLDEIRAAPLIEPLFRALADLPGTRLITCRSAVYQELRPVTRVWLTPDREYHLPGLTPPDQLAFLTQALGGPATRARDLHGRLQASPALRPLANNPLMLRLIASISGRAPLPRSRAAFYRDAEAGLRRCHLEDQRQGASDLPEFDDALNHLAATMGLDHAVTDLSGLRDACRAATATEPEAEALAEALTTTGLIRIAGPGAAIRFLHPALQEYHVAGAWAARPLAEVLAYGWCRPRCHETLALLLSRRAGGSAEGMVAVDATLTNFVTRALARHHEHPEYLGRLKQSPLRTVLHLIGRAALPLDRLPAFSAFLEPALAHSARIRLALAAYPETPPDDPGPLLEDLLIGPPDATPA